MPRQTLLKKLDLLGYLPVPEVRVMLEPYTRNYQRLIIQDKVAANMDIKGALHIYISFHQLSRQPS
jgi:hypothetical protein